MIVFAALCSSYGSLTNAIVCRYRSVSSIIFLYLFDKLRRKNSAACTVPNFVGGVLFCCAPLKVVWVTAQSIITRAVPRVFTFSFLTRTVRRCLFSFAAFVSILIVSVPFSGSAKRPQKARVFVRASQRRFNKLFRSHCAIIY